MEGGFYLTIAVVAFVLLLVAAIGGELFEFFQGAGDSIEGVFAGDVGGDIDLAGAVGSSFPTPFSSRVVFAGLVGFGLGGWLARSQAEWGTWPSALAAVGGFLFLSVAVYFGIAVPLSRMEGGARVVASEFVGMEAEVTSAIPEGSGIGRVTFNVPAIGVVARAARSRTGDRIPSGSKVEIVESGPTTVVVIRRA
jgi:hypothetical protein